MLDHLPNINITRDCWLKSLDNAGGPLGSWDLAETVVSIWPLVWVTLRLLVTSPIHIIGWRQLGRCIEHGIKPTPWSQNSVTAGRTNVDLGSDGLLDIVQGRQLLIDDAALVTLSIWLSLSWHLGVSSLVPSSRVLAFRQIWIILDYYTKRRWYLAPHHKIPEIITSIKRKSW